MIFISEQQKQIVLSEAKYKLINGCAGSRKTDTLIKCAIYDLKKYKRAIEFLTLVGSVTDELKTRLEKELNITIHKQGTSNHYVGYYNEIPICISNYDAWVHLMLENTVGLSDIGECYTEKVDILLNKSQTENLFCYMKNKTKVGLLIIDEVQDLSASKMNIIANLSTTHQELDIYCAGDYLQTLFFDDKTLNVHSMNLFKRIHPTYFDLSICMRCPKAHVDFNNLILGDIQKKYMLPLMQSDNDNMIDKPFLFTHHKASDNTNARITAEQVTRMIDILMTKDETIVPNDIACIMSKSNGNEIFFQLQDTLPKLYEQRGYKDCVLCMSTYGDGIHNSLDWNKANGKTKLLSIHGDKGRGHKVVFFLGLTEKSIPRDIFIFKPSEIISESLLNVGLTRSTKYLFIGFTHSLPSRYILEKKDTLDSFVYSSWSKESFPEPYRTIRMSLNNPQPIWMLHNPLPHWIKKSYKEEKLETGIKSMLEIKGDISKVFEQTKNIVMHPWKKEAVCISFGKCQTIHTPLQEEHHILLGLMSELLIQRISNKDTLFELLQSASKSENNIYTDDERFLSCMYDIKFKLTSLHDYFLEYKLFFDNNPELKKEINYAVSNGKNVVHSIFQSLPFQNDLNAFLSNVSNKDLKTETIWNVTLFHNQIRNKSYRPAVNSCVGFLNEEISILHENIEIFIQDHIKDTASFEEELYLYGRLTPEEMILLKKVPKKEPDVVSVSGRCDIYDTLHHNLYEIKASRLKQYSQEWLTQTVMYTMMLNVYKKPVKQMYIVNVLNGCLWKWTVPTLPKIEDMLSNKICKKFEWHDFEIRALIAGIEKLKN